MDRCAFRIYYWLQNLNCLRKAAHDSRKIIPTIAVETFLKYQLPGATNFGKKGRANATIFAQQGGISGYKFYLPACVQLATWL